MKLKTSDNFLTHFFALPKSNDPTYKNSQWTLDRSVHGFFARNERYLRKYMLSVDCIYFLDNSS